MKPVFVDFSKPKPLADAGRRAGWGNGTADAPWARLVATGTGQMKIGMTAAQAKVLGMADGIAAVNDVLQEQGADVVVATLRPGHLGWDEDAINNAAHRFRNVPEKLAKTYYKSYEKAAIGRAKQIRSMQEARARGRR